jgi:hypothetical protein
MKKIFYVFCIISLASCKKEGWNSQVEIYPLKSYTSNINQSTSPYTISISNAVPEETAFVNNEEIRYYDKNSNTFKLTVNIKERIKNFKEDKGFVVTVDKKPVYYGRFHPSYLSSLTVGVATIDPIMTTDDVKINYVFIDGSKDLQLLDKRNDENILQVLKASRRLKK